MVPSTPTTIEKMWFQAQTGGDAYRGPKIRHRCLGLLHNFTSLMLFPDMLLYEVPIIIRRDDEPQTTTTKVLWLRVLWVSSGTECYGLCEARLWTGLKTGGKGHQSYQGFCLCPKLPPSDASPIQSFSLRGQRSHAYSTKVAIVESSIAGALTIQELYPLFLMEATCIC